MTSTGETKKGVEPKDNKLTIHNNRPFFHFNFMLRKVYF
jgi:hypothetical protein